MFVVNRSFKMTWFQPREHLSYSDNNDIFGKYADTRMCMGKNIIQYNNHPIYVQALLLNKWVLTPWFLCPLLPDVHAHDSNKLSQTFVYPADFM